MGKYAPRPGCANCAAIKELCMDCALDWRLKHTDKELNMLRDIARMAETLPPDAYVGIVSAVKKWRAHRKQKPLRRNETCPTKKKGAGATPRTPS